MDSLIAVVEESKLEEVRIQLKKLKGKNYLDIRVYSALKEGQEKIPTGKGLVISPATFQAFKKAVESAEASFLSGVTTS